MIDQNKKELIFDNIIPREIGKNSKELDFHDQNDLIRNSKKSDDRRFAKKTNLVFFIIVQSFTIFIVINLVFLSLDVNKSRLDDVKIKVNRGEILDRNGEVLAASIDTKDFLEG